MNMPHKSENLGPEVLFSEATLKLHHEFEAICEASGIATGILPVCGLDRDATSYGTASSRFMMVCPDCNRDAIIYRDDRFIGQDFYKVWLGCWFCGWAGEDYFGWGEISEYDSAVVEIEKAMRKEANQLKAAIEEGYRAEHVLLEAEVDAFAEALHKGWIEPDDF